MPRIEIGAGSVFAGVLIGLDRQEKGLGEKSAVADVAERYGIPVVSVITLESIVDYLSRQQGHDTIIGQIKAYQERYGVPAKRGNA